MATKKKPTTKKAAKKPEKKSKLKAVKGGKENKTEVPAELTDEINENGNGTEKKKKKKDEVKISKPKTAREDIVHVKHIDVNKETGIGCLEITYKIIESDGSDRQRSDSWHNRLVHPDTKKKFEALRPHLALLCGYLSKTLLKDISSYTEEHISDFEVRGIIIGESKQGDYYKLTGLGTNYSGKRFSLVTPLTLIEEDDATRYKWMDDMDKAIKSLLEDVKKYAKGELVGQAQQTELEFPETSEDDNKDIEAAQEEENFAEEAL